MTPFITATDEGLSLIHESIYYRIREKELYVNVRVCVRMCVGVVYVCFVLFFS